MLATLTAPVQPTHLEEFIERNRITAISFDAGLFSHYGYSFNRHPLSALKALAGKGVRIVLSDIVMNEMREQFHELSRETLLGLKRALHTAVPLWDIDKAQNDHFFTLLAASEKRVDDIFRESMRELSASIVNLHDYVPSSDAKYIKSLSSLERGNCGKYSRIILKSLSTWAQEHGMNLLVLSWVPEWLDNCAGLDNLYGVDNLKDALTLFHKDCSPVAREVIRRLQSSDPEHILATLDTAFRKAVEQTSFIPGLNVQGYLEGDIVAVELIDVDYGLGSMPMLTPLSSSDKRITFMLDVELHLEVYAHLSPHRREQLDAKFSPQGTGEEVFETWQHGSVVLIFTKENGHWKYSGHEQPDIHESLTFDTPLEFGSEAVLEKHRCLIG